MLCNVDLHKKFIIKQFIYVLRKQTNLPAFDVGQTTTNNVASTTLQL